MKYEKGLMFGGAARRLGLVIALLAGLLEGCMRKDRDGATPSEIAESFIVAVQKSDYPTALTFWNSDASVNLKNNSGLSFTEFCEKYFKCDNFELGTPYTGKSGIVFVDFRGVLNGESKAYALSLSMVENKWLLIEHRLQPGLPSADDSVE